MKLIDRLQSQLEAIGATLDRDSERFDVVYCDAPEGYYWACGDGLTVLAVNWESGPLREALADVYERLAHGCEKLDAEGLAAKRYDCGDDNWGANLPADAPERIEWTGKLKGGA